MPQNPAPLRLGTRGSKLALAQAESVRARLAQQGTACMLVIVKTFGDRIQDRPLADLGGKGLFTKELEQALLADKIDLAVHSVKDMPGTMPEGLMLGAVLPREDPRDAFISNGARSLGHLPKGGRIGTSSVRRRAQIARARPDLDIVMLRGNVDTRLARLDEGDFDAILLAHAGLKRLGLQNRVTALLSTDDWLPALAQGAVGVQVRSQDERVADAVRSLDDAKARVETACERGFQLALDGSCRTPIAGLARLSGSRLAFRGEVLAPDGGGYVDTRFDATLSGAPDAAESHRLGFDAGSALKPRAAQWLAL